MCPDGTNDLQYPDRVVPFFNLDGNNASPTCQQVVDAAQVTEDVDCSVVQAQAGYCGCVGIEPQRKCSFCPGGAEPGNLDLIAPSEDSCRDLYTYIDYLSEEDCDTKRLRSMQGLSYICGCPGVEPQCSLCPDGSPPPLMDKQAQPTGETCRDMLEIIEGYTADVCLDSDTTVIVTAARCGCPDSQFPVCSVQQNPHLCTHELLDAVADQNCECYSFCDGKFSTCHDFPGGLLNGQMCSGVAVSGCNRANANGVHKSDSRKTCRIDTIFSVILGLVLATTSNLL